MGTKGGWWYVVAAVNQGVKALCPEFSSSSAPPLHQGLKMVVEHVLGWCGVGGWWQRGGGRGGFLAMSSLMVVAEAVRQIPPTSKTDPLEKP
ncbi:hypothetical protein EV1_021740 [Malus domestica]